MIPSVDIYDNGGKTFDRYTVFFPSDETSALGIGPTGNVPNGFCMWVFAIKGNHLGKKINFADCPIPVRKAIKEEWKYQ